MSFDQSNHFENSSSINLNSKNEKSSNSGETLCNEKKQTITVEQTYEDIKYIMDFVLIEDYEPRHINSEHIILFQLSKNEKDIIDSGKVVNLLKKEGERKNKERRLKLLSDSRSQLLSFESSFHTLFHQTISAYSEFSLISQACRSRLKFSPVIQRHLPKPLIKILESASTQSLYPSSPSHFPNPLSSLRLGYQSLQETSFKLLSLSIITQKSFCVIDLRKTKLGLCPHFWISTLLRSSPNLLELYLDDNNLKDEGALYLCRDVLQNKSLEILSFSKNNITKKGVKGICDLLISHPNLKMLCLVENEFGEISESTFSPSPKSSLHEKPILPYVRLFLRPSIKLDEEKFEAIESLSNLIKFSSSLTTLELLRCGIGKEGKKRIEKAISETIKKRNKKGEGRETLQVCWSEGWAEY